MVDASLQVQNDFQLVKDFVKDVFHSFSMSDNIRYGLVIYGNGNAEVLR